MKNVNVLRISFEDKPLSEMAFMVRRKVFVEEEGVDPALEYDANEPMAHHYLVLLGEKPVGTARWRETPDGIKLERFAVLKEFRNQGIGEKLVAEVINDVLPSGKKIYLHSQLRAVPFYERNGFTRQGEIFYEANMGHFYMEYTGPR